jgi:tRNA pseudouridine(55) synthase
MPILAYKRIGETPLETLDRLRLERSELEKERLSYAGRLDPLAEGLLLILVGEECDEGRRNAFLGLDKVYEVEILFGFSTDSYDLLGIPVKSTEGFNLDEFKMSVEKVIPEFIGESHGLKYPAFSSKTVGGRPLFELAKSKDGLPDELPEIKGSIKGIEILGIRSITTSELKDHIHTVINLVKGDFRQKKILEVWDNILLNEALYPILKLSVSCESGVYMRSLADSFGKKLSLGGLAFSIKRTKIGDYLL